MITKYSKLPPPIVPKIFCGVISIKSFTLFGAEPLIWPDHSLENEFPLVHTRNRYLRSGGFIGRAKVIKELLRKDINKADDDQLYYQRLFLVSILSL